MGLTNKKVPVENARTYFNFEMNVERYMIKSAIKKIRSEETDTSEKGTENLQNKMVRKERVEKQNHQPDVTQQLERIEKLVTILNNKK